MSTSRRSCRRCAGIVNLPLRVLKGVRSHFLTDRRQRMGAAQVQRCVHALSARDRIPFHESSKAAGAGLVWRLRSADGPRKTTMTSHSGAPLYRRIQISAGCAAIICRTSAYATRISAKISSQYSLSRLTLCRSGRNLAISAAVSARPEAATS
jgi:hypothetical protein